MPPVSGRNLPGSQTGMVLSPSGFLCSPRSCGTPGSSSRHTSRTNMGGAHGTGAHGEPTGANTSALQLNTAGVAKGDTPVVGRLDTGRVSTTSSLRERVPAVYQTLSLTTTPVKGKDPFADAKKSPPKRRRKPSFHTAVPVAVAVTACDIVDTEEHQAAHPGHVDNLRSMAANWSNAHRCRVTFVSAKSGIGISGAVASPHRGGVHPTAECSDSGCHCGGGNGQSRPIATPVAATTTSAARALIGVQLSLFRAPCQCWRVCSRLSLPVPPLFCRWSIHRGFACG